MTHAYMQTGLEHLSEQELLSLAARIHADLTCNQHSAEDKVLMTLALHRIRTALLRKRTHLRP